MTQYAKVILGATTYCLEIKEASINGCGEVDGVEKLYIYNETTDLGQFIHDEYAELLVGEMDANQWCELCGIYLPAALSGKRQRDTEAQYGATRGGCLI